jgi:hypothetical protein
LIPPWRESLTPKLGEKGAFFKGLILKMGRKGRY